MSEIRKHRVDAGVAYSCHRCGALVHIDDEDADWWEHVAEHERVDRIEYRLSSLSGDVGALGGRR